jgi:hypothetical protein
LIATAGTSLAAILIGSRDLSAVARVPIPQLQSPGQESEYQNSDSNNSEADLPYAALVELLASNV